MKAPRLAVAVALCVGGAAPVAAPAVACAGEGGRAALVVDTGAAVTTYCVALPEDSVSGLELVELAGDQHGLDYSLGFGGEAVCRLEGVGPEGDDCFGEYPEFWGYWHGDGSGGWTWAGTGAGGASIEDGDVDGWSWGAGDNGSNHQAPPATEHEDVCPAEPDPAATVEPGRAKPARSRGPRPPSPPESARPDEVSADSDPSPHKSRHEGRDQAERPRKPARRHRLLGITATPSPAPTSVAAEPTSGETPGGPPLTGVVGLAAAGLLGVAAWRGSRRKKA